MRGDFKIQVFLDTIARSRSLFWAWHNTAFMTGTHCALTRENLDKARARLLIALHQRCPLRFAVLASAR